MQMQKKPLDPETIDTIVNSKLCLLTDLEKKSRSWKIYLGSW